MSFSIIGLAYDPILNKTNKLTHGLDMKLSSSLHVRHKFRPDSDRWYHKEAKLIQDHCISVQ